MFKNLKNCIKPLKIRHFSNRNITKVKDRGMIQDVFPDTAMNVIPDILNGAPQAVYAGFDPTADSLHVGNLLVLINLLHWQRGGHLPIALIGGATAKIGDPSGKSRDRDELSYDFISENVKGVKKDIENVFENHKMYFWEDKDKLAPLKLLNNDDWFGRISAVELLRNAGRLRMGSLLSRTSVQTRLNSAVGMSFTEFSYQLFQAYDWLHLYETQNCKFQIGGNDQLGNIKSGHDLISKIHKKQVYGLTVPLITTEMGNKFGKTAGNAIWLNKTKTSPFTLYQFFIRTTDKDVEKQLKLFTFTPLGKISELMQKHAKSPELLLPQKYLAEQLVRLIHGQEGLDTALKATKVLYESSVQTLSQFSADDMKIVFEGASVVEILPEAGQSILDLALKVKCFSTKEDAIRIISAGGFYINQQRTNNPNEVLNLNVHRLGNNVSLLRVGKRNYYIVKWLS